MNFEWDRSQVDLYERTLAFARAHLDNDRVLGRERADEFPRAAFGRCGEFGLTGLCLPVEHGGLGLDALTTARAIEALGRGCLDMGLVFSVSAHLFACAVPIALNASESLKARIIPRLASGQWIGANAITEAEAGSDVFALKTTAVRDGNDYILNGAKSYVTNGPVADVFLIYATTNPEHGYMGVSAFAVRRGSLGLAVGEPFHKIGLTTSPISSLYLDSCRVEAENRIGPEGNGAQIFKSSMRWERGCLFAGYLGLMDRQLEEAIAFARERRQGGKPIAKYQAVSHRIVDMKVRLEAARLLLYRACWAGDRGDDAELHACLGKLFVSEAAIESGLDAIRIHGGAGVMHEIGVERALRDALPAAIFSGTSEVQRNMIAVKLGL